MKIKIYVECQVDSFLMKKWKKEESLDWILTRLQNIQIYVERQVASFLMKNLYQVDSFLMKKVKKKRRAWIGFLLDYKTYKSMWSVKWLLFWWKTCIKIWMDVLNFFQLLIKIESNLIQSLLFFSVVHQERIYLTIHLDFYYS